MRDQRGIYDIASRQQKATTKHGKSRKQHNSAQNHYGPHDTSASPRSPTDASPVTALTGYSQQGFTIALLYFPDQNSHQMPLRTVLQGGSGSNAFI